MTDHDTLDPALRSRFRRVIGSALIGNMLEFYDLSIYGFLALYIAKVFFPTTDPYTSFLIALATFGVSYFVRPLGAIVIGSYADRHGAKAGMMLTIWSMGLGTAMIALAPSYAAWGIAGTLIIVAGKLLQGFSAGGEFGTSVSFVTEHAPRHRRGFFASFQVVGIGLSTGMAGVVTLVLTQSATADQITAGAWRIPFFIGLVVVPFGYWLRRNVEEVPGGAGTNRTATPLRDTLATAKARITCAIGVYSLAASTNYLLGVYIPLYAQKELGMSAADSMYGAIGYAVAQILLPPVVGVLSDRFGRMKMITLGVLMTAVLTVPAFLWMVSTPTVPVYVLCVTGLTSCVMVFQGGMPAFLAELFPKGTRTTGLALIHNLNFTVFGGLSLLVCAYLSRLTGSKMIPAYYVMTTVGMALVCLLYFRRQQAAAYDADAAMMQNV